GGSAMIRRYVADQGRLRPITESAGPVTDGVWFDVFAPTPEEEAMLEQAVHVNIPNRADMEEIEISSRLYYEGDAAFMTAVLPARSEADAPEMAPVTFILADGLLITVRYHEPQAFRTFPLRAEKASMGCDSAESVLIALLEVIVDRLADILERVGRDVDRISRSIFRHPAHSRGKSRSFQHVLAQIGLKGDLSSNVRDSLASLERMFAFLAQYTLERKSPRDVRARLKTLTRDAASLSDHAGFLSQKITFLLDATLGMINIEQNA